MSTAHKTVYDEMNELHRQITYHADLYFNKDTQEIPNHVYDEMVERFEDLAEHNPDIADLFETANKPVPIHEPTNEGLKTVQFDAPMLSLQKALNQARVDKFLESVPEDCDKEYELKLDGLALELKYVDGPLVSITTRGDGLLGEDVTHARRLFGPNIQDTLLDHENKPVKGTVYLRGEGVISWENFRVFNETAVKQAVTPRNAVSGWIRALEQNQNQAIVGVLHFLTYGCSETFGCKSWSKLKKYLTNIGVHCAPFASLEAIRTNLHQKIWPCDGIVIKVDDFELQRKLGTNNKYPLWAIAYKYPDEEGESELTDIEWGTTRTGRVVPVAFYTPVKIGGVTCARALLDNYKQFMALELRMGSRIAVTRNGDVIPRLNRVIEHGHGELFKAPEDCPSCYTVLEKRTTKQSSDLVCTNVADCPAQLVLRCVNLFHKRSLDVDGLGPVVVAAIVQHQNIKHPYQILHLGPAVMGEKIWRRIVEVRKGQPLYRLIKALGLPGVDLTRAKKLSAAWPGDRNLIEFLKDADAIVKIPGFSAGLAIPISLSFEDEDFLINANGILSAITLVEQEETISELKVCITGSIGPTREELHEVFGDAGIELVDKLTNDCNFLIIGEKPGQSKILKAAQFRIPTINTAFASSVDALIQVIKAGVPHD